MLPWGNGLILTIADPDVKPEVREQLLASVTDFRVYVVVDVTGEGSAVKDTPLKTPVAVLLAVPSL
jgi:hypothetical protein